MPSRCKKKKPLRWVSTIAKFLRVHAGKFFFLIKVVVYCLYSIYPRTHVQFPWHKKLTLHWVWITFIWITFCTLTMFPLIFFRASALESFFVMIIFHTRSSIVTRLCLAFWYPFCKWSECSNKAFKNVMEKSLIWRLKGSLKKSLGKKRQRLG